MKNMSSKSVSRSIKKTVKAPIKKTIRVAKVVKKEVKRSATTIARAANGSKAKSSGKPAGKKTIAPKASAQKIYPNKRPVKRGNTKKNVTPAINLINTGAHLLKKVVVKAEENTTAGRRVVKSQGLDLVGKTSRTLHALINRTTDTVSGGLKKL
jgi:hypothetical protein